MDYFLLALLIAAKVADVETTNRAIAAGAIERVRFTRWLMKKFPQSWDAVDVAWTAWAGVAGMWLLDGTPAFTYIAGASIAVIVVIAWRNVLVTKRFKARKEA